MKRILYSVSKKICNFFYETEYRIRFCMYETDSVFRFIKKFANFFMKRNTESVSVCKFFYETEYRIRFIHTETDSVFHFINYETEYRIRFYM